MTMFLRQQEASGMFGKALALPNGEEKKKMKPEKKTCPTPSPLQVWAGAPRCP